MKKRAPHTDGGEARENVRRYRREGNEHRRGGGAAKKVEIADHDGALSPRSACSPAAMAVMWYCRYSSVKKSVMMALSEMPKRASMTLRIMKYAHTVATQPTRPASSSWPSSPRTICRGIPTARTNSALQVGSMRLTHTACTNIQTMPKIQHVSTVNSSTSAQCSDGGFGNA